MKFLKSLLVCLMIFTLIGCQQQENDHKVKENGVKVEKKYERDQTPGKVVTISLAEMEEKIANKDSFAVMFSTSYCLYCRDFHLVFDEYIKEHNVVMYEIVLDNENQSEQENLRIIKKYFDEFNTTPGVFYVKNGKNASYLDLASTNGADEKIIDKWVVKNKIDQKK